MADLDPPGNAPLWRGKSSEHELAFWQTSSRPAALGGLASMIWNE
jgi:hypothetical protein